MAGWSVPNSIVCMASWVKQLTINFMGIHGILANKTIGNTMVNDGRLRTQGELTHSHVKPRYFCHLLLLALEVAVVYPMVPPMGWIEPHAQARDG